MEDVAKPFHKLFYTCLNVFDQLGLPGTKGETPALRMTKRSTQDQEHVMGLGPSDRKHLHLRDKKRRRHHSSSSHGFSSTTGKTNIKCNYLEELAAPVRHTDGRMWRQEENLGP